MGESNPKQQAIIKKRERLPRVPCKIKGCLSMIPETNKSGLCGEHWRNRKKLKTSGYYEKN